MKVGIPREIKNHEYRVAITPAGVHELVRDRRQWHLDALFDRNGACARLDRPGVAADVVDRLQTRGHGCSDQITVFGRP